ncbi:MAG: HlyC/CorC family transporter [Kordiimonadaceae bacterium]|nr:HlyC/CorC family transporter [Kordiimonadaceae bacterium]
MTLLITYLLLALVVSSFCSISEAVLLSVRPSYVAALNNEGRKPAQILHKLINNLDRPLAAILTANTIAHTVGAAGVGAQASLLFGNQYLGLTSAILTFLILVLSEIIPKTVGANYWKQLAPAFAVLIEWLTKLLFPFVWMSAKITRLISRSGANGSTFSRAEIKAMAEIGAQEGLLQPKELKIVINLLRLRKLSVRMIMTPRPVIFAMPATMTVREFFSLHDDKPFSRIPVYDDSRDNINGYVLKTDLLIAQAKDQFDKPLSEFRRELLMILDSRNTSDVFDLLMHEKSHMALVIDEFGTVQGLITQEDIVEALIGLEITDETDRVEDMQALAHEQWRKRMTLMGLDPDILDTENK